MVPPVSDAVDEWTALLEGGGLTPPPIPPSLLPPDSFGDKSRIFKSDGSKSETKPVATAGMGTTGQSKSPKIDLGTVELNLGKCHITYEIITTA